MQKLLFTLVLTALLTACAEGTSEPPAPASAPETFTATPQPVAEQEVPTLPLGATAPDFKLMGVDGKYHTLADYEDAELLVLIFTANHCPTAQAYEQRMIDFTDEYRDKGVQVVAISPNSPLGLLYEELGYSDLGDDYEDMIVASEQRDFNFPYLYDGDDHAASLKYGPVATPHAFVFDKERKLRYVGHMDKVERPGTANAEVLRAAVDDLLAGEQPEVAETKTFGCSTKWAWKTQYKEQKEAEWLEEPVVMNKVENEHVAELVANSRDQLRLINFWATWCGPCVQEFPDLMVLHRMYGDRDFELMTVSMDNPDQGEKTLKALKKMHSPVANYHYIGDDKYEMIELVDPEWNGALPYTLIVEPGGEVVYRHQGSLDFMEVKQAIVEHEMIGRYF